MKHLIDSLAWLAESGARLPMGPGWFPRTGVSEEGHREH
jgi:hypothetical protein